MFPKYPLSQVDTRVPCIQVSESEADLLQALPESAKEMGRTRSRCGSNSEPKLSVLSQAPTITKKLNFGQIAECFDNLYPFEESKSRDINRFMFYSNSLGAIHCNRLDGFQFQERFGRGTTDILSSEPFWLDISNPSRCELEYIQKAFEIHPLTIEDIVASDTRQKVDVFPNYYYILIKSIGDDLQAIQSLPISILMLGECIVSIHFHQNEHVRRVIQKLKANRFQSQPQIEHICYLLIDDITNKYLPVLRSLEAEIEVIEDLVSILRACDQSDMLQRISLARKGVSKLARLVNSKPELIKQIGLRMRASNQEIMFYMEDAFDHAYTMKQDITQFDVGLNRSHSHYLAQISIEITQASNRGNELTTKMTVLASILVPLNVITGLWGMNVNVPGQSNKDDYMWFFGILSSMALIAIVMGNLIKRLM